MTTTSPERAARTFPFDEHVVIDSSIAPSMDAEYVKRLRSSGLTAVNWTVCSPHDDRERALLAIARARALVAAHQDALILVRSLADIDEAKTSSRVGVIFGPQNALPVVDLGADVELFYDLGVRILQLTYNEENDFGAGCAVGDGAGLSRRGRGLVDRLNANGIAIDVSHANERTMLDAIDASRTPVIVSHANARSVFPSPRNVTDAVLRALAARGGLIGLTLWSPMVGGDGARPTLDHFVRHVQYVYDLIGPQQMALGSDHSEGHPRREWEELFGQGGRYPVVTKSMGDWYNYDTRFVRGAERCGDLRMVADALSAAGFSHDEIGGIFGGNLVRVLGEVWR